MKRLVAFVVLLVASSSLWANGDPVATYCALTLSRNPVKVHVPEVQLKDEHLTVTPMGRYTLVRVEYLLWNNSKKDFVNLTYGFPIDYYRHGTDRWAMTDGISDGVAEAGWRDNYVTEVLFTLNDIQLPFQVSADSVLHQGQPLLTPEEEAKDTTGELFESRLQSIDYAYYKYESDLMRRWYYTRLDIPAGKAVKLVVQYRIENRCNVGRALKDAHLRLPYGNCSFAYDFSPAAYWGNGKAETFDVLVDVSHVRFIQHPNDTAGSVPEGLLMQRQEGNRWRYTARNFDLAKAEPLRLQYWIEDDPAHLTDLFNHRIVPGRYTLTVSGADPKYPTANLSDMDLATATVLRRDRNDSLYITIRFKQPTKVKTIVFYNGYTKSVETWHANSRVESMMVFDSCCDPWHSPFFCDYFNPTPGHFQGWYYIPKQLRATAPDDFTWQGLTDAAEIIHISDYYDSYVLEELHFAIADIAKGKKYSDICVSEIILLGE